MSKPTLQISHIAALDLSLQLPSASRVLQVLIMSDENNKSYEIEAIIQSVSTAEIGENLASVREPFNACNSSSVAVIKSSITVPRKLSVCYVRIVIV